MRLTMFDQHIDGRSLKHHAKPANRTGQFAREKPRTSLFSMHVSTGREEKRTEDSEQVRIDAYVIVHQSCQCVRIGKVLQRNRLLTDVVLAEL